MSDQNTTQSTQPSQSKFLLLDLLAKVASASISQAERLVCEEQLKQLGMIDTVGFVSDLCEIIGSKEIPEANPCKDHATIHLKNYLRQVLNPAKGGRLKPKAGAQVIL